MAWGRSKVKTGTSLELTVPQSDDSGTGIVYGLDDFDRRVLGELSLPVNLDQLTVRLFQDPYAPAINDLVQGRELVAAALQRLTHQHRVIELEGGDFNSLLNQVDKVVSLHPEKQTNWIDRVGTEENPGKWWTHIQGTQYYWTEAGKELLNG